ncbi:hypothetical protein, partial [Nocardia sp. NPDC019255]|uniref:hypothetical protein n=1 Tax=Nocardia sp. NPDC019255 TaxID=3154591 RepID=UPI0034003BE0
MPTHFATSCEQAEQRKVGFVFATPAPYAPAVFDFQRLRRWVFAAPYGSRVRDRRLLLRRLRGGRA